MIHRAARPLHFRLEQQRGRIYPNPGPFDHPKTPRLRDHRVKGLNHLHVHMCASNSTSNRVGLRGSGILPSWAGNIGERAPWNCTTLKPIPGRSWARLPWPSPGQIPSSLSTKSTCSRRRCNGPRCDVFTVIFKQFYVPWKYVKKTVSYFL